VIRHDVNRGEGGARNTAIEAAVGEWIALLDSDDAWLPGHLDRLWRARDGHVLVFDSAVTAGAGAGTRRLMGHPSREPVVLRSPAELLVPESFVPSGAVMVRRDVALDAGLFAPLPYAADLDLWVRVLERGTAIALPGLGLEYHVHDGQVTADPSVRRGPIALLDRYADRPWCASEVRRAAEAKLLWDAGGGRRARAALAGRPRLWPATARLLRFRAGQRARLRVLG
jgi:glycosyltransferase involved in cell wall biosynthesis